MTAAVKAEFFFAPGELDRLELRRVEEEPNDENANELFTASLRKVKSTSGLVAGDVRYIVGKIGEPTCESLQWITREKSAVGCPPHP